MKERKNMLGFYGVDKGRVEFNCEKYEED